MSERRIREVIELALAERQLVAYGGSPAGGGTWPDMAFLATLVVLREWGIDPECEELVDVFIAEAVNVALDRLSQRISAEDYRRLLAAEPPDRPSRSGKGVVGYAADHGFSTVRRCPRCNSPIYNLSKSAGAIARGVPGVLWIYLEGAAAPGADGVIDVRSAPVLDYAGRQGGYVDSNGLRWPERDVETPYSPPITLRCHGGSRTLPRGQRGSERCGAVVRVDENGEPSIVPLE